MQSQRVKGNGTAQEAFISISTSHDRRDEALPHTELAVRLVSMPCRAVKRVECRYFENYGDCVENGTNVQRGEIDRRC